MDRILKVAIIGYGKMGKIRASCAAQCEDLEIVAVCDTDPKQKDSDIPFFQDYKQVISLKPDIVFVCTVNKFLAETTCFFLDHGIHVFCEKPPGRNKEDVQQILACEARNPGVKLKFGFNHRYHQAVLDAKALVDNKRLGPVMWMRGVYGKGGGPGYDRNWRNDKDLSGGGILLDQGIHMVDLFRLFCGNFQEVKSFIGQSYWPGQVEDNAFVLMRNGQGQVAMLHSSATQWHYKFLLDIYLKKGYITISGILSSTRNYGTETLKIARCTYDQEGYPQPNPKESITYYDEDHSWSMELQEFLTCIKSNEKIQVGTCQDALETMLLIEDIYRADKEWGWLDPQKEKVNENCSSIK